MIGDLGRQRAARLTGRGYRWLGLAAGHMGLRFVRFMIGILFFDFGAARSVGVASARFAVTDPPFRAVARRGDLRARGRFPLHIHPSDLRAARPGGEDGQGGGAKV